MNNYRTKKSFRGFEQNAEDKVKSEDRLKALRNIIKLRANANPDVECDQN